MRYDLVPCLLLIHHGSSTKTVEQVPCCFELKQRQTSLVYQYEESTSHFYASKTRRFMSWYMDIEIRNVICRKVIVLTMMPIQ